MVNTDRCYAVSAECPVSATTLGYYPNLGANAFFLASFTLCAIVTVAIGVWKRTWAFGIVVGAGFFLETCGTSSSDLSTPLKTFDHVLTVYK
jgi:hypothetical protein